MDERLRPSAPDRGQQGFTVVEVLIALAVLLVGMAGILMLQLTSSEATAFSRHATEASVLAEDKMEFLRTSPAFQLTTDDDRVDARGVPDDVSGFYVRQWTITPGDPTSIAVQVSWFERGTEPYSIVMRTQRKR